MRLTASAIVLSLRAHGENGAVVRLLTAEHGLMVAYVWERAADEFGRY